MWTFRKALIAAVALLALFFLFRSTAPPPSPPAFKKTSNRWQSQKPVDSSFSSQDSSPPPEAPAGQQQEMIRPRTLQERLQYQFPYDLESKFPAYIWQTWKVDPSSVDFEDHLRPFEASWSEMHPGFVHEVITDDNALYLIKYLYASVPEIIEAYVSLPVPVLKADFFRYLVLLARGGIYSDIDTQSLKPASEWLPKDFDRSSVGLLVGIEADPDRPDWAEWYSRRIQFCQWTIQSKPGHPVLIEVVTRITEEALRMKKEGILKVGKMSKSVVEFTGPAVWTDSVFAYFNDQNYFDFTSRHSNITWRDFTGIQEHKKIGDVIILPITSFSPGVGQMGAGEYEDPMAFVRHAFGGSWKPKNEQNGNPVY